MSPRGTRSSTWVPKAYEAAVYLLAFGVLVNAFIAGRVLIGDWDIDVHGVIGNVIFVLAVAAVVLAGVARADRVAIGSTVVLAVLVFAQVGLGYSGRDNADAVAWHVANGVLVFGTATWVAARCTFVGITRTSLADRERLG
jgi:hypothetical protein